ncbi:MAG: FGGY-family carbohydrate kinase [bacterium]|nr:FGGY-family carbohydrate kinase [bacterium]
MSEAYSHGKDTIRLGKAVLGIEFGSTRIKAVLVDETYAPIASGTFDWENHLENGIWTYGEDEIWNGLAECYRSLADNVKETYDVEIERLAAIGFSGMMHGYMAFDKEEHLLVPFRTWRNTITGQASEELTELFQYNIPQRWSIAHLYQAILNKESHVKDIQYLTTLAGYIHWQLTGKKVIGVGEASGMFPIDPKTKNYNTSMLEQFGELIDEYKYPWKIEEVLPKVLVAGEQAGELTKEGARRLDPTGHLQAGCLLCPPEGDAGTGMAATNSVRVRTGNVSAGTSVFGMVVLEKELKQVHKEIDLVTTPAGHLVAMAHCNNCTSDLNAWVGMFDEFTETLGVKIDKNQLFEKLYTKALEGDKDCGGLISYNYFSGEPITDLKEGRPLFVRKPDSKFTLANFMRTNLYSSLSVLKIGFDLLTKQEQVKIDKIYGHGGLFKTKKVGQGILAAALNTSVSVMETAGEGGAWGMALLASYMVSGEENQSLDDFLEQKVFKGDTGEEMAPEKQDVEGFNAFIEQYQKGLAIEKVAVEAM